MFTATLFIIAPNGNSLHLSTEQNVVYPYIRFYVTMARTEGLIHATT